MKEMKTIKEGFVGEIRGIIDKAREGAVRSVDFCRVQMYWNIGRRIFEEEQQGKARAEYGSYLIKRLAERLEPEYGSGFGVRQLEKSRKFYRTYSIASALRTQLNWTQYKLLIAIPNEDKRKYYELEAVNNGWNSRELERQINSGLEAMVGCNILIDSTSQKAPPQKRQVLFRMYGNSATYKAPSPRSHPKRRRRRYRAIVSRM